MIDAQYLLLARQVSGVPVAEAEIEAAPEPARSIGRCLIDANGSKLEVLKAALDRFITDPGKRQDFYTKVISCGLKEVDPTTDPAAPPIKVLTADSILTTQWPAPVVIVPDVLTAGLGILAGPPKVGKGWLALQILQAVTAGGMCLGREVEQGPAWYLALEDSPSRLAARMKIQRWPMGLPCDFLTIGGFGQIGHLLKGGAEKIARQIEARGYRLVVIDTLSRAVAGDQSDVEQMTKGLAPLQETALKLNCGVLLNDHHSKAAKQNSSPDVIADILGSTAKGAVVDTALGLYRERGKAGAKLAVTGREIAELTLALTMDWALGCWQCEGDATEIDLTERRQEIINALAELGHPAQLAEIAKLIGQAKSHTFTRLQDLANAGKVKKIPEAKGVFYALP